MSKYIIITAIENFQAGNVGWGILSLFAFICGGILYDIGRLIFSPFGLIFSPFGKKTPEKNNQNNIEEERQAGEAAAEEAKRQAEREIVLEAVKQNGYALRYASQNLK